MRQDGERPISAKSCQHILALKKPAVASWRNVDRFFGFDTTWKWKVTIFFLVFSYLQAAHSQDPAFALTPHKDVKLSAFPQQAWLPDMGVGRIFSRGGPVEDFPKIFFQGGAKSGEIWFCPSKLKKQPFFANNFKIQGGPWHPCPPFRRPCFQIVGPKIRIVTWNRYSI